MTLPDLVNYPTPATLPASRADWILDPSRAALLVHDLQRYFLRPYAPGCGAITDALTNTARLLEAARAAGIPIFYTAQTGRPVDPAGVSAGAAAESGHPVRGLQGDLWGPGMSAIQEHTEIVPEVAPRPGDTVLVKHRYNAFAHSDLETRLAAEGRDQLIITGVYAHIGVVATALDAFQREIRPFVAGDAVADFSAEAHQRALAQVASCCGVVAATEDLVASIADGMRREVSREMTREMSTGIAGREPVQAGGVGDVVVGDRATHPVDVLARGALEKLLPAPAVAAAFEEPTSDLFELGLDSIRAFELLDVLAEGGIDVDFGDFARHATIDFLRAVAVPA